jgi:hypothetical protein
MEPRSSFPDRFLKGLPRDFKVVVIPHIFMEEVGQDVFVRDLSELEEQIKAKKARAKTDTLRSTRSEKYCRGGFGRRYTHDTR